MIQVFEYLSGQIDFQKLLYVVDCTISKVQIHFMCINVDLCLSLFTGPNAVLIIYADYHMG